MKKCLICGQKTDVYTCVHKNQFFVDGRLYSHVCFTCFFVPKIQEQKYDKSGSIIEEIELPYCCDNINNAEDLYKQGAADSRKKAQISVDSVKRICIKSKKTKSLNRPTPNWNIC